MSVLVVFSGLPATGKSSVAARLLERTPGVHLSTDEARERLFPRALVGAGVKYGHEASLRTYEHVEMCGREAIESGARLVILDGTYMRVEDRGRAIALGLAAGAEVLLLEILANETTILGRLAARKPGAEHFSEADLTVYRSFREKLGVPDGEYTRPEQAELRSWAGQAVVGASFDTDNGVLRIWFGAPSAALRSILLALDSRLAG